MDIPGKEWLFNKHFLMKIAVLICGEILIHYNWSESSDYVIAYELACLKIILGLTLTYVFFESTPVTEICFLVAALFEFIVATIMHALNFSDSDDKTKFYVHLGITDVVMIIIVVDIILNARK